MRLIIWMLVALLVIFHQDFWNWESDETMFGFMPIGLFYHACLSVVASVVWWLACVFAWPEGSDDFGDPIIQNEAVTKGENA
ncbi:MAG: DUF3311 domain-containing protein [Mariniblastus sp.]